MEGQPWKRTAVLTCNRVYGYAFGLYWRPNYGEEILCFTKPPQAYVAGPVAVLYPIKCDRYSSVHQRLTEVLEAFNGICRPAGVLDSIYLFVGRLGLPEILDAAKMLKEHCKDLELVACECKKEVKKKAAQEIGARLRWSECGGYVTMDDVVDEMVLWGNA